MPFLRNVLRGKGVSDQRMAEVAEHYLHFGGISPINEQNRDLIARLSTALAAAKIDLPVYWGNRNWRPSIVDALRQIQQAGHQSALPIFTNMFSSYSGCRQYRENIAQALQELAGPVPSVAPRLRFGFNHPRFVAAQVGLVSEALQLLPEWQRSEARLLFTAHSIPQSMAQNCKYVEQLREAARLVAAHLGNLPWELVYQSRSGPPQQPWLEPDIGDRVRELASEGVTAILVSPLGFITDHMEVMYDLDTEVQRLAVDLGVRYQRAPAVGAHPEFISMLVDLVAERLDDNLERRRVGNLPALHDVCPDDCCLYPRAVTAPSAGN